MRGHKQLQPLMLPLLCGPFFFFFFCKPVCVFPVVRRGNCKKASVGLQCEVGLRCRRYYVLCGSVLSVWNELEEVLTPVSGTNVKVQIVRLRTEDGQRIVGKLSDCCTKGEVHILETSLISW